MKQLTLHGFVAVLGLVLAGTTGAAARPVLYAQPAHQSPVRGEPDDLLLLAGSGLSAGDQVVYRAVAEAAQPVTRPASLPGVATAETGTAEVVSNRGVPDSLVIRLPSAMRPGQTYALWVRSATNEWSDPVLINDARPLWVSPAYVHATTTHAGLPRSIKVIGRNLQPAAGSVTQVRLTGPQVVEMTASHVEPALDHFVAEVALPKALRPGSYRIEVRKGREQWKLLPGQLLEVRDDPAAGVEVPVAMSGAGACRADDEADDTRCLVTALATAARSRGAVVVLGRGVWRLDESPEPGTNGIVVPAGVSLRGEGKGRTVLVRGEHWGRGSSVTTFTLLGGSALSGLTFRDERRYRTGDAPAPMLRLGTPSGERAAGSDPEVGHVSDVIITGNQFRGAHPAIADSGSPLSRLFITDNEFGAYSTALRLEGNRFNVNQPFKLEDAVIAFNRFNPGSDLDSEAKQGAIASELGAGHRVDFSHNTADGSSTAALYAPGDAPGWRAAFFWHLNGSQEQVLISQNTASCTGDKTGDGEAIALDNNGNTFGTAAAATVLASTANSVTLGMPLLATQHAREVPADAYYVGHWVTVGSGPGVGQARKIESYRTDPVSGAVTLKVAPAWDVVPASGVGRVGIGRAFWQAYVVANTVDHRSPPCRKSNRSARKGGGIVVWAQAADSAIDGNMQFDTDGIVLQQLYSAQGKGCLDCVSESFFQSAVEIRGNRILGEYDRTSACSSSGIGISVAASPTPDSPPPTIGTGLTIAHNVVEHADGWMGGAIAFSPGWYQGPVPHRWPLVAAPLIFHNTVTGVGDPAARPCRTERPPNRTAISVGESALVAHPVMYANACPGAPRPILASRDQAVIVCPLGAVTSCGCPH
jgi:hypothetical protein